MSAPGARGAPFPSPVGVVFQTTHSFERCYALVSELMQHIPELQIVNTLCRPVRNQRSMPFAWRPKWRSSASCRASRAPTPSSWRTSFAHNPNTIQIESADQLELDRFSGVECRHCVWPLHPGRCGRCGACALVPPSRVGSSPAISGVFLRPSSPVVPCHLPLAHPRFGAFPVGYRSGDGQAGRLSRMASPLARSGDPARLATSRFPGWNGCVGRGD